MHIIKPCPSCGKNLRFPVNKGKIRVTCVCGHAFVADPDDPKLFKDASFDISAGKKKTASSMTAGARLKSIVDVVINSVLTFIYKVQNFRLLPAVEKAQVMLVFFIIFVLTAAALIFFLYHPAKQPASSPVI